MSDATHAAAAPVVSKLPIVAVVVLEAVCLHINTVAEEVTRSEHVQFHPVVAVGSAMTPELAVPPVPTFTRKATALPAGTDGLVPNPDEIVGAVAENASVVPMLVAALSVVDPVTSSADEVVRLPETSTDPGVLIVAPSDVK